MSGALTGMLSISTRIKVTGSNVTDATGQEAGVRFGSDGVLYILVAGVATPVSGEWITPYIGSVAVEVRCDVLSGTVTSGDDTAEWLSLSASQAREWSHLGTGVAEVTIQLRNLAQNVITSQGFTLAGEIA